MSFARRVSRDPVQRQMLDRVLFSKPVPPNKECAALRQDLINRFRKLMQGFGAKDAHSFLSFLVETCEGYDYDRDGASKAMQLVWEISELNDMETEQ